MSDSKFSWTQERFTYLITLLKGMFQEQESGKGLSSNDFTGTLKDKLDGIASGAQANVVEIVKVNGTALTPDANKAVNIPVMTGANASTGGSNGVVPAPTSSERGKYLKGDGSWDTPENTTYSAASQSADGLMSSTDKAKLDGIDNGADANTIETVKVNGNALTPDANKAVNIPVMTGANASTAGSTGVVPAPAKGNQGKFLKGDGSWDTPENTTYNEASQSAAGLMSAADKTKLDGVATGATANVGTVTGVKMNNGTAKTPDSNGIVNLGTVITAHQDISGKANLASPEFTGTPKVPTATAGTNTTQAASTAFVAAAITAALNNITGVTFSFVASFSDLPATGAAGTFYFVPASDGSGTNNFIEYVWNASASKYEEVGRPEVDLSGYMQTADWPIITEAEIDAILASA